MTDENDQNDNNDSNENLRKTVLEAHGIRIDRLIGSGTYAKVKLGYSEEFNCNVAVKVISKTRTPREYITKFLPRETDVVRGLRHQNLIHFYQSIETTARVYIIMEYAENGSLLDHIKKKHYLTEDIARKYFKQLISVVDYFHSQGVVHRDIKCENLLLDRNYDLKIIDFGFARKNMKPINNKPVRSETFCGSYAYASPEILKGVPYDPRYSDSWATGVVLFAMVFGRLPFNASYQNLVKQVQSEVNFPKKPKVSDSCKNLIKKILAPLRVRISVKAAKREPWVNETPPISQLTDSVKSEALSHDNTSNKMKSIETEEGAQTEQQKKSSASTSSNVAEPSKTLTLDSVNNKIKTEEIISEKDTENQMYSSTKLESISIVPSNVSVNEKSENISENKESNQSNTIPPIILDTAQIASEPIINGDLAEAARTALNSNELLLDETDAVFSLRTEESKQQEGEIQNVVAVEVMK